MAKQRPIVFIGPSGAGKSTLASRLLRELPELSLVQTYTTRPARSSDDVSHRFVTPDEFTELQKNNTFIGTLQAFGYKYGLPPLPNTSCLLLLRVAVIPQFKKAYPESVIFEIEAPSSTLEERLSARASLDRINHEELQKEMQAGRALADMVIDTSHSLDECVRRILEIIHE